MEEQYAVGFSLTALSNFVHQLKKKKFLMVDITNNWQKKKKQQKQKLLLVVSKMHILH